jgi:futalosine hydrolase
MHILLVSATFAELRPTIDWLAGSEKGPADAKGLYSPKDHWQTEHLVTGVGQLQTACGLLKKIYTHRPDFIIQAGIAGAAEEKNIGQVFGIRSEKLADLGVAEKNGFKSVFELNLGDPGQFPFSDGLLKNPYSRLMEWSMLRFLEGITVNEISTSTGRIDFFKQNGSFFVESMEGAALHYVCLMEKIPFLQIRSVSNVLGERDKTRWKIPESLLHLNEALILLIQKLQSADETIFRI